jgi:hypothetical protein
VSEEPGEPVPVGDRRGRELTAVVLWLLTAVAWVVAAYVPWYGAGVPGATAPLDVARLLRTGVLGVPPLTGYAVLLQPVLGLVLLGLAPLRGATVMMLRVLLWLAGTVTGLGLVVVLGQLASFVVGPGAVLTVLGCVLGGTALGLATVRVPRPATRTGWAEPPAAG